MNVFNLFRKHDELRREFDALKHHFDLWTTSTAELQRKDWEQMRGIEDRIGDGFRVSGEEIGSVERRLDKIESEIASMQAGIADELRELRQRLDMPQKRRTSGRPFSVLSKLAERGAAEKQNA